MSSSIRERDHDEGESGRSPKRTKVDDTDTIVIAEADAIANSQQPDSTVLESPLPPSHALLGVPEQDLSAGSFFRLTERDVGISEYIGRDVSKIDGIIKQRFTDFLVYEVDLDGNVIHITSLDPPEPSPKKDKSTLVVATQTGDATVSDTPMQGIESSTTDALLDEKGETKDDHRNDEELWPERFNTALTPFLSVDAISQVKKMYLEGPEPPWVSDSGWSGRQPKSGQDSMDPSSLDVYPTSETSRGGSETNDKDKRGKRGRGGHGGRSGRGGGQGGRGREDTRKVLSDPIPSKTTRTAFHETIREVFGGKLDTETDSSAPGADDGSRIVIKWSRRGRGRGGRSDRGGRGERSARGNFPPFIHFTLQKTNRETQDALAHLSRILHVNVKDLSVAGTKDKRGVTVQRVSVKRGNKTIEDIWKLANGQNGRKSLSNALNQRGERGVRVADLNYRKAGLDLGMLKGNAFVITLRNVQVDSMETLDRAMNTVKHKGFINYYGMQRFGTASVPTHSIGLAILQSDWHKAVSLILQKRPGEHPDVGAARDAWLIDGDLHRALELMPRRVVAERCILESYKKQGGETRNAMGALSTIPRTLRLMYVHAYQSYVWNAIVSERIRIYGSDKPVVGDLVFETDTRDKIGDDGMDVDIQTADALAENTADIIEPGDDSTSRPLKKGKKPWAPPRVKMLTDQDLQHYSIFDVVMPLPGKDVAYPGGALGEKYREYLKLDGLDPDDFSRKQKEYSLGGSYRAILHLPKELSWSVLRYTDPDVALAQADEDELLGFDPPVVVEDGKFMALQIYITLGTAAYATMALREVTKTETSSHFQTSLTQSSEDQKFRGGVGDGGEEAGDEAM